MMLDLPSGTVIFLCTDIEGSTALRERDTAAMCAVVKRHFSLIRGAAEAHGGVFFKTVGDAAHAAFPTAPNALAAVTASAKSIAAKTSKIPNRGDRIVATLAVDHL